MSARRILITGATSGLGLALVREAVARGHSVLGTGRSAARGAQVAALGAAFHQVDLVQPDTDLASLVCGQDSVIHAAAFSSSWGAAAAFEQANTQLTRHLLNATATVGVQRFVFVSSPSIFADFRDRFGLGENDPPADPPLNHYARTKLAAERAVRGTAGAMACCAIRPRALVGPGDAAILPRLAALARRKRMPLPGGGTALIELTDLRDAAWAICEAEARAPALAGRAINLSGGQPRSVRSVAVQLSAALGAQPRLIALPLPLARAMAVLAETIANMRQSAQEPVLTRYSLATLAYSQTFDPEPARQLLGFTPRHDALTTLLAEAATLARNGAQP